MKNSALCLSEFLCGKKNYNLKFFKKPQAIVVFAVTKKIYKMLINEEKISHYAKMTVFCFVRF